MAVVTVKYFIVTRSPHPLAQGDLDTHAASVNAFLAGVAAANVLDVDGSFAPGGTDNVRSTYTTLVIYLA